MKEIVCQICNLEFSYNSQRIPNCKFDRQSVKTDRTYAKVSCLAILPGSPSDNLIGRPLPFLPVHPLLALQVSGGVSRMHLRHWALPPHHIPRLMGGLSPGCMASREARYFTGYGDHPLLWLQRGPPQRSPNQGLPWMLLMPEYVNSTSGGGNHAYFNLS